MKNVSNSKSICNPLTIRWERHNVCCTEDATVQFALIQFCLDEATNNNLWSTYSPTIQQNHHTNDLNP
jgi:hypothetical protein